MTAATSGPGAGPRAGASAAAEYRAGVVLAPNWLGDAVMSLPAVAALRRAYPACAWTVLARPAVAPVYRLAGLELRVETLPPPPSLRIPRPEAEIAVIFPNSFYAGLLGMRLGARRRVGYGLNGRQWLLSPAIARPEPGTLPGHESFYYLELLRRAGLIAALPAEDAAALRVPLRPPARAVAEWRQRLGPGPIVAMHVGATFGTAKRWLPERFAELAAALAARGVGVVLVGSPAERELARRVRMLAARPYEATWRRHQQSGRPLPPIEAQTPGDQREPVQQKAAVPLQIKNLAGETTLEELVALLQAVDLLVANDSGPMHLAGAVGTKVVALFGSTNHKETYPMTEAGKLALLKVPGIDCSPCKKRECPIDHRCMTRMAVDTVLHAVVTMLGLDA